MTSTLTPFWQEAKLQRRRWMRWARDLRSGQRRLFSQKKVPQDVTLAFAVPLSQPIMPGPTLVNKLSNIRLASQKMDHLCLQPGQILSFWVVVGRPSLRRGFRFSRNIVGGQVSEAVGGGLCQVSGILYHLALLAGLDIVERHPHSLDIYREEERFSPLGADATVVYGYKDLRIQNCHDFPVTFSVEVQDGYLTAALLSPQPVRERDIEFRRDADTGSVRAVTTLCRCEGQSRVLSKSTYRTAAFPSAQAPSADTSVPPFSTRTGF